MQLDVVNLSKRFGGLQALRAVSLQARGGEVTAVIGPNGAGKSTLLDCLSGMTAFDSGHVCFDGTARVRLDRTQMIALGVTRTFQHTRVFNSLTVAEHVALAHGAFRRSGRSAGAKEDTREVVARLLDFIDLGGKAASRPAELSYGERRRLEIARGMATKPRIFLLDEPAAGSTLSEHNRLAAKIAAIAATGAVVILVEHHMGLVADVSHQVVVLNFGSVLMTGTIDEVRRSPEVISAYLGVAA